MPHPGPSRQGPKYKTIKTLFVLGPGGHSTELLALIDNLDNCRYTPRLYAYPSTDWISDSKTKAYEASREGGRFESVPARAARGVGQSWLTTPLTFVLALWVAFWVIWRERPLLIVCNGPGMCVPFVLWAFLFRLFHSAFFDTRIVFVESLARVETLSLSGKLVYPLVDAFFVQWPGLKIKYPKAKYQGLLL